MQEILANEAIEAPPRNVQVDQPLTVSLPAPPIPPPTSRLGPNPSQLTPHVPKSKIYLIWQTPFLLACSLVLLHGVMS